MTAITLQQINLRWVAIAHAGNDEADPVAISREMPTGREALADLRAFLVSAIERIDAAQ